MRWASRSARSWSRASARRSKRGGWGVSARMELGTSDSSEARTVTSAPGSRADSRTEYFPGANPHPVMRIDDESRLIYANSASDPLLTELGVQVGEKLPDAWCDRLRNAVDPAELRVGPRTFELLSVRLPELG